MSNTTGVNSVDYILTLNNPAFGIYLICTCLLVLKMMGVTLLTIYNRFKFKTFICPEDAKWMSGQVSHNDTVERIRRAHQNDLENISIFFAAGLAYLWTLPNCWVALILYGGFTIFRYLHTFVYTIFIMPQPTRAILWLGGFLITGYMAIHTAIFAFICLINNL